MGNEPMIKPLVTIVVMTLSTIVVSIALSGVVAASIPITPWIIDGLNAWCGLAGITTSMGINIAAAIIVMMIYAMRG